MLLFYDVDFFSFYFDPIELTHFRLKNEEKEEEKAPTKIKPCDRRRHKDDHT